METSTFIAPARFDDPAAALAQVRHIYDTSIAHLRDQMQRFVAGHDVGQHVRACYPFVRVQTSTVARADSRLSYGFVSGPGVYDTTLTRPDLFEHYYLEQFTLLMYTDGVVDTLSPAGQRFTAKGIERAFSGEVAGGSVSAQGLLQGVVRAVERFRGPQELGDDLTLVAVQGQAKSAPALTPAGT